MEKKAVVIFARIILVLGAAALLTVAVVNAVLPGRIPLEWNPPARIVTVALAANILFVAFPFRRRNDLVLGLAIVIAGADLAARASFANELADAAGIGLAALPVWAERSRHRARRLATERRKSPGWFGRGRRDPLAQAPSPPTSG